MHPPCELMVESFLPAMRGLVAHDLAKKGFSQSKISKLLGVTQPAVNQYLAKPQSFYFQKASSLGISESESSRYAALLGEDLSSNQIAAVYTLYTIWRQLLFEGRMCDPHRAQAPELALCDVCMKVMSPATAGDERTAVIEEIKRAVRLVEDSNAFPNIMPEVSVNLVMSTKMPKGEMDVAAMPGRIVNVKGRARGLLAPEFGVSHHMARVLLAVHSRFPSVRAAINIRYDEKIAKILKKGRIEYVATDAKYRESPDPVLQSVHNLLPKVKKQPQAIVDAGGPGIEPIAYLFGETALNVVKMAIGIAQQYQPERRN